jgi:hypothetical protein
MLKAFYDGALKMRGIVRTYDFFSICVVEAAVYFMDF